MKQQTLFAEPKKELIRSIHQNIVYVRTTKYDGKGARLLAINVDENKTVRRTQETILQTVENFFSLYGHQKVREYDCETRKKPALETKRQLYNKKDVNCRVSLRHLISREWDVRGAQRREESFLQASIPKDHLTHKFLLRLSSPWIQSEQGSITRRRNEQTYHILVEQELSEIYRTQFLTYLQTADTCR